jgi:hypothetical protein
MITQNTKIIDANYTITENLNETLILELKCHLSLDDLIVFQGNQKIYTFL